METEFNLDQESKMLSEDIRKELDKITARATSRRYTREYQDRREQEENTISYKELVPATLQNYETSAKNWMLLANSNATSSKIICREHKTSYSISKKVKDDVLNNLKYLTFNIIRSSQDGSLKRWRYNNKKDLPKNWLREHPALGISFVFWVIVHGVADRAFKGLTTMAEVLSMRPPNRYKSLTLEWNKSKKELLFLRMIDHDGPQGSRALTFSALRHSFSSLAQRMCFRDKLRVHRIRRGVANQIDPKASKAARGQALDHQNHSTFLKYQSVLKSVDIQSAFYDIEPDYECRDMEQSLAHHRDINMPQKLDAATITKFTESEEVQSIIQRIRHLTFEISGKPHLYEHLAKERSQLYTRKAKASIQDWWNSSYEEYITGNEFTERDRMSLFEIYKKYLPERARVRELLFTKTTLDSEIGRACLEDMVTLCTSTERVVYYPGLFPKQNQFPTCARSMFEYDQLPLLCLI
ncbi:hypothetical protein N7533_011223 [Penicillium manginii]|uniref:uncharacterized protein n=1 Tax=Penicillium manginii TaxID=203109 RepID=UPI0025484C0B|nr:uncharacterized protein N7533_011223 [Penicillium manginii]KAJ5741814.1 hypothetical protein N7533_011223 [Penicillium manginii]